MQNDGRRFKYVAGHEYTTGELEAPRFSCFCRGTRTDWIGVGPLYIVTEKRFGNMGMWILLDTVTAVHHFIKKVRYQVVVFFK